MNYLFYLCKLCYLSRGLRLALLCYLCLVQFAAPLVHAHGITGGKTQQPDGLHYLHPYGLPPSTLASLLTSTCEQIEVGISQLEIDLARHPLMKSAQPSLLSCARAKTQILSQPIISYYPPIVFYYSCSPRSPPAFS